LLAPPPPLTRRAASGQAIENVREPRVDQVPQDRGGVGRQRRYLKMGSWQSCRALNVNRSFGTRASPPLCLINNAQAPTIRAIAHAYERVSLGWRPVSS
jgi:hypothetical protein